MKKEMMINDMWETYHSAIKQLKKDEKDKILSSDYRILINSCLYLFEVIKNHNYAEDNLLLENIIMKHWCFLLYYFDQNDKIIEKSFELMVKKRSDYGVKPLLVTGQIGVLVKVISKLYRIQNLLNKKAQIKESIEDTKLDIFNYCIIGLQLLNGDIK